MNAAAPRLSLVVLSFRRFDATTGPCLGTLAPALEDPRFELLLVDNGSDDGSAAACAHWAAAHPAARWLPQSENLGFAGGMNAGAAAARGAWICLVNNDTLFPPGAADALLRAIDAAGPDVAMLGPVTNAAGNAQCLPVPGRTHAQIVRIGSAAMRAPTGLQSPTYRTDFFCVAIRRDAWERLGGLSSAFGLGYYEDFDFSLRLRAAGYEQRVAEDVYIVHVGSATFASMGAQQTELLRRNRKLLRERHPDARFERMRDGNAAALRHLLDHANAAGWSAALRARAAWRLAALDADQPKSPWKRALWRWRTRAVRGALAAAGIAPAWPRADDPSSSDPTSPAP